MTDISLTARVSNLIAQTCEQNQAASQETLWKQPLCAFADAADPLFADLRGQVSKSHMQPWEILPEAESVIVFFLPFVDEVPSSNIESRHASALWAETYTRTNTLIDRINHRIQALLLREGYLCETTPATRNFNRNKLISDWSHRHVAYIAGLGTLGLNNMLITDAGCCGRIGSCVTSARFKPTSRPALEYCLHKSGRKCGVCAGRCVNEALTIDGFDRFRCYAMCIENDKRLGLAEETDVCGKCLVDLPCSNRRPGGRP